MATDTNVGK